MNVLAVCIGILFFLNPCVTTIDVLPDFIGALLLLYGTSKIHFLSERIEGVNGKIWGLFAVGVLKAISMLFVANFDGSTQVMLSFAFAVAEGLLIINIISAVTDGLEMLKIRYGTVFGDAPASEGKKRRKKTPSEKFDISKFKLPICIYTVFRLIMCFLPEATELRISKTEPGTEIAVQPLSEFKGLLYGFVLPIVCFFMIFAVIRTIRTFKLYGSDKKMLESFETAYIEDKRDYPTRHKRKTLKTANTMFIVGVVASVYFYADNKDLLPKILAAAAFAVLIGYFAKDLKEKLIGFTACAVLTVSQFFSSRYANMYFKEYTEDNALWLDGAAKLYRPVCITAVITAICLFIVIMIATVLIRRCTLEIYSTLEDLETTEKKIKKFKRQITFFRIVTLAFCIIAALYIILRPSIPLIIIPLFAADIILVMTAYFIDMKL